MYVQGESSLSQIPFYFHLPVLHTWTDCLAFSFPTARFMISLSLSLSHTSIILWRKPWSPTLSPLLVFIGVHVCVMRLYFNGWMKRFVPCCSKKVGTEIRNIFFSTCQSRAPYSFFLLFWLEGTCLLAAWFPVRIMSKTFPPKMRPPYPLNKCVIGCSAICVCFQPLLCFCFYFFLTLTSVFDIYWSVFLFPLESPVLLVDSKTKLQYLCQSRWKLSYTWVDWLSCDLWKRGMVYH